MALDAAMLFVTARQLRPRLVGARIDKIYMPARDEIVMQLRTQGGVQKLLISARPGNARVHLTEESFENPAVPPSFCMLLRKHLASARITDVRTEPGERILFLDFEALNEMGDRVQQMASIELMGRYSNFVLVNGQKRVIDALKRIDAEQSDKRQLLPGILFTMPPRQEKLNAITADAKTIIATATRSSKPLSAALLDCLAGVGPVVCREIAHAVDTTDPDADRLTTEQLAVLETALTQMRAAANGQSTVLSIVYDGEKPMEYSFMPLRQYGSYETVLFDDVNTLFDRFYAERDRIERMRMRSHDLSRQVVALIERTERKHAARLLEQQNTALSEQKKRFGELINANLYQLRKGMAQANLLDYYTGQTVVVPLDAFRTPVQNAQKYYKEYRKLTTAAAMLKQFLENDIAELQYLRSVQYEIAEARTEEDFWHIREELRGAGYLRGTPHKTQRGQRKAPEYTKYQTSDGFLVYAGRNNVANDRLTMKIAKKHDIWLHVKQAAGSHVILVTEGAQPTARSLEEAAMIAAVHSSQQAGHNIAIDYTEIKNVHKMAGQKPGMVVYDRYATIFAAPDNKAAARLRVDSGKNWNA